VETVGEVKGQSRDDYQYQDYVVSHGNSVSTSNVAVETRSARVRRLSSAIPQVFTALALDAGRRDVLGNGFPSPRRRGCHRPETGHSLR
jgi:hypothetical protein